MAAEEVEFKFPSGGGGDEAPAKKPKPEEVEDDNVVDDQDPEVEIEDDETDVEVVDDTPPKDRNKKPAPPPEDVTEDELENYSEKVKKRIKHFTKGYHDQRRAADEAARQRDEAVAYAKSLAEKVKTLEGGETKSKQMVVDQAKRAAQLEHDAAKRAYRDAYESGDADAVAEAQSKLTEAAVRLDRVKNFKFPTVQTPKDDVQQQHRETELQPKSAQVDPKAKQWADDNQWYGSHHSMTAFAIGYHRELIESGVDPRSDEYYEKLNTRMRQVFPDQFEDDDLTDDDLQPPAGKKPPPAVVASATRSVAPKKITLTKTQAEMARKLGVPLKEYALEVAKMRKQENV